MPAGGLLQEGWRQEAGVGFELLRVVYRRFSRSRKFKLASPEGSGETSPDQNIKRDLAIVPTRHAKRLLVVSGLLPLDLPAARGVSHCRQAAAKRYPSMGAPPPTGTAIRPESSFHQVGESSDITKPL